MSDSRDQARSRRKLPPLNALRAFDAVAYHLSFTAAAQELLIDQAAVSRHVSNLEDALQVRLFWRRHKRIGLTSEGAEFAAAVSRAFDEIETGARSALLRNKRRALRVRLFPTMAMRWLVPRLARFQAIHPDVNVQITTTLDPVNLAEDEADITVHYGNAEAGLCYDLLMPEVIVPVCAPSRASGPPAIERPEHIRGNILLHSLNRARDWRIWFKAVGFPIEQPTDGVSFETSILAYQAALAGVGFAIAQLALVRGELESGRLVAPVYRPVHTGNTYFLACLTEKANLPAVAKFRAWAIEEVARDRARFGIDFPQPDGAIGEAVNPGSSRRSKKRDTRLEA